MDAVIESIAERVKDCLFMNNYKLAKTLIFDPEEWFFDFIKTIHSAKALMKDSVFSSVFNCGYENVYWNEVRHSLEMYFVDELAHMEGLKDGENDEEDLKSDEESE